MMKKTLSVLMLSALPVLALAGGDHKGGHDMAGHDMQGMHGSMHGGPSSLAVGKPGNPAKVDRTVEIVMDDAMRFTPANITVKKGETIRFFIKNTGKVPHEMVIGSMDELKAHAEMMRKMPQMQHAEPNMVTLQPGQRGGLVWQFDQAAGTVDFACLVPGHMEAGMVGKIVVQE